MDTTTGRALFPTTHPAIAPVLVFRTSVERASEVEHLRSLLDGMVTLNGRWNFDLEDRDRILRIEHPRSGPAWVITVLRDAGFQCAELE